MRKSPYIVASVALLILLATLFVGCTPPPSGNFTEGRISYRITYDSLTRTSIPQHLLPSNLTVRFKDNNTNTQIGGMLAMGLIRNYSEQQYTNMVNIKFTGTRLKFTEPITDATPAFYAAVPEVTISEQTTDCQMFGLNCKRTTGLYRSTAFRPFEIIYTNDISIVQPNSNTPFAEIDGVLLAFSLYIPPFMMHIKAIDVRSERVANDIFESPKNFNEVDAKTITDLLQTIMK